MLLQSAPRQIKLEQLMDRSLKVATCEDFYIPKDGASEESMHLARLWGAKSLVLIASPTYFRSFEPILRLGFQQSEEFDKFWVCKFGLNLHLHDLKQGEKKWSWQFAYSDWLFILHVSSLA